MSRRLAKNIKNQQGQTLIFALTALAILLMIGSSLLSLSLANHSMVRYGYQRNQALALAEAGVDHAIRQLNSDPGYQGTGSNPINLGVGEFETAVSGSGQLREVTSIGCAPSKANCRVKRTVKVTLTMSSTDVSFHYGVQAGEGGIVMENNSQIIGNVYSNGPITGDNGALITETAVAARLPGEAENYIRNVDVLKDVYSPRYEDSVIGTASSPSNAYVKTLSNRCQVNGNAYADSIDASCTVTGNRNPSNNLYDKQPEPFAISEQDMNEWKADTLANTYTPPSGTYTPSGSIVDIGPIKINGNLQFTLNQKVNITGTVYVTGSVIIENNVIIKLDAGYSNSSGVIISDGVIEVRNNSAFIGSSSSFEGTGNPNSFVLLVSTSSSVDSANPAINVLNNANAAIFFAPNGIIKLNNNMHIKEATAYKLYLSQNAIVTYDYGLQNTTFTSGPGGGWRLKPGTWRET